MGLPDRKDVPTQQTWDVGVLYENDDAWQKDIEAEKRHWKISPSMIKS